MSVDRIHTRTPDAEHEDDEASVESALVDVSALPAGEVEAYAREAADRGERVHIERRPNRTYLVTG
jgi:hypothetical protein